MSFLGIFNRNIIKGSFELGGDGDFFITSDRQSHHCIITYKIKSTVLSPVLFEEFLKSEIRSFYSFTTTKDVETEAYQKMLFNQIKTRSKLFPKITVKDFLIMDVKKMKQLERRDKLKKIGYENKS